MARAVGIVIAVFLLALCAGRGVREQGTSNTDLLYQPPRQSLEPMAAPYAVIALSSHKVCIVCCVLGCIAGSAG